MDGNVKRYLMRGNKIRWFIDDDFHLHLQFLNHYNAVIRNAYAEDLHVQRQTRIKPHKCRTVSC